VIDAKVVFRGCTRALQDCSDRVLAEPDMAADQPVAQTSLCQLEDLRRLAVRWTLSWLAAEPLTAGLGRGDAGLDAPTDKVPLELGERAITEAIILPRGVDRSNCRPETARTDTSHACSDERFAEVVDAIEERLDAIETEMSESDAAWPDLAADLLDRPGRIDDDDILLAGRRGNKLGLAFVGLCPPFFPVGRSACLVASLKYDLPRIISVGTGRRRQNQVRPESSVRRSQ
jgi:hypothetical protein